MKLENITLSKSQTQKITYYIILFVGNIQNKCINRERTQICGF